MVRERRRERISNTVEKIASFTAVVALAIAVPGPHGPLLVDLDSHKEPAIPLDRLARKLRPR
ncbi:MAG: hypothetical protein Cons2KO_32350 [Congregibacter sp.]